ncbi:MAG: N-acetylglutaminylglutamine amidotransferase [Bradymonadales bacterium]|nr:MAG: N-acetylglutaminylglutamine amidotransferase [Bradymonadales bacterium]
MCGIAGEIRFDGRNPSLQSLSRALERMRSRGPDSEGVVERASVALGHRRLKIIDFSENAHQPMVDNELGLSIVFNGCIYNYKELRKELQGQGYRFFSSGDTEVILKAFHAWGKDCVQRFHGMFAFGILQHESGKLALFRDRLGIKPLYYAELSGGLVFGSQLTALLEYEGIDRSVDPEALQFYMTLHSIVPPPWTILQGIRKLPPASWMEIDRKGSVRIQNYWELRSETSTEKKNWSFDDWKFGLEDKLTRAVERRTVADVPVGVLLSGGLDSSLVVGLLSKIGQSSINTFSIGFEATQEEEGNEFRYSDVIAKAFSTQHHKIQIDGEKLLSQLPGCIEAMSEPMVSHDNIGFYLLSREVSKHVKVVQSGQGADEVFAGYHWYPPMMEPGAQFKRYQELFFDRDRSELQDCLQAEGAATGIVDDFVRAHYEKPGAKSPIDRVLRIDTTLMLIDDPVKRVDNMTMASGLEARVPFLDHELVEFASEMPAEYKVKEGGKFILKEVARKFIPNEVIDRPKGYFPVPQLKYLRGASLEFVKEILNDPSTQNRALFKDSYIQKLLQNPESHITPLRGSKLWQIALLELWLNTHLKGL